MLSSMWFRTNGAFTSDANEALSASDLHVQSMQRCNLRELSVSRKLKNRNFGEYSCRVNQSRACSSSDVITT